MKQKKWTVCDFHREPFDKCELSVFGILLLNMLSSNVKKVEKTQFCNFA